jgi:hypothetical protein
MTKNDVRCICEIKSRIAKTKAAFHKKKALFSCKMELNLRRKRLKCYIWSIGFYCAKIWTLRKVDNKYLEKF